MKKLFFLLIIILCSFITAHAQTFHSLDSITHYYQDKGNYDSAYYCGEKALAQAEKQFGNKDINYAASLYTISVICWQNGKYAQGIAYSLIAKTIIKGQLGGKHPDYADVLNILAILYYEIDNYTKAEPLYIEIIKIDKEAHGEKHPDYAISLINLARLYQAMGNYPKAEPLYIEASKILKETLGEKHYDYACSLDNLVGLYEDMGNYTKAEALMIEAMQIDKEVLGKKHPDYATSVNNMALLYYDMGNYTKAEPLMLEAMQIYKEVLGEKHPDYAQALSNLAMLYKDMGNYTKAEPLMLEAMQIHKEALGEKHPDYATSVNNLALLYYDMGNYTKAEPLMLEAMQIRKEVFGEKHPDYALSLLDIAELYQAKSDNKKAEPYYLENLNICLANIRQNFSFLSEKEKENYVKTIRSNFNAFTDFAFVRYRENPLIAQNLYNITLATKGLLLSSSNRIRDEIFSSNDTVLVKLYKNWQELKEDIGRYSQWSKFKLKRANLSLDSLENLVNTLEKEISLKSNAFSNDRKNNEITWKQVQEKLGDREAAIEFITYNPINFKNKNKKSDTTLYCALALRKEDKYPQMLILFSDKDIPAQKGTTEINQSTAQVKDISQIIIQYVNDENESRVLYKLLWKPLDTLLKGKEKIYVSLSGMLNKISFNALQDDKKQLLLNKYNLCFVNSSRQLATEVISKAEDNKTISLFGGINYDLDTKRIKSPNINSINNTKDLYAAIGLPSNKTHGNNCWNYLPGTLTEVENINKVFTTGNWNTKVYTGNEATEEVFKSLSGDNSPSIIHIATHGFFFPKSVSTTNNSAQNLFQTNSNPLWRSGILLAGANYTLQGKPAIPDREDGVLTAYEVANCNLRNTDLVVLSACETGLGDIKSGEGVYGLQRSFQVAGAKAVIMSLWSVPDKETNELMTLFYESYIKNKNKHDSFRNAQENMAKKYAPYYWAAFVLVE